MQLKYNKFLVYTRYARPTIMWIMAISLLYYYLIAPILNSVLGIYGIYYALPSFDQSDLNSLVIVLLGSSALRTFEKYKKIQGNH